MSTGEMLRYIAGSDKEEFVIETSLGIMNIKGEELESLANHR